MLPALSRIPLPTMNVGVAGRDAMLAIGFGGVGVLAFPPLGWWPLILVSLLGFVTVLKEKDATQARSVGLLYGLTYALGTMHWFFNVFPPVMVIPLLALMGGYFGLLATLIAITRDQKPLLRGALTALFAVGVEWLRGDAWYLRFPWYTPPHALAAQVECIAAVRWLGVYGLSGVVWFLAAWAVFESGWRRKAAIGAGLLLLPACSLALPTFEAPNQKVLLVQGERFDNETGGMAVETVIRRVPAEPVDLAVLPEYAYFDALETARKSPFGPTLLAKKVRSPVVFGAILGQYGEPKFENVAAVLDADGALLGTFTKQHPLPLFGDGVPGKTRPVFPLPGKGTLGVAICYDFDAPEVAASLVRKGATVLVVPTYDALEWGIIQHETHELIVRLRAVENDRWLLRAASSGRSEVIDPHGRPSSAHVPIGGLGYVIAAFGHRTTLPLGTCMSFLGPISAAGSGCVVLLMWNRGRWAREKMAKK